MASYGARGPIDRPARMELTYKDRRQVESTPGGSRSRTEGMGEGSRDFAPDWRLSKGRPHHLGSWEGNRYPRPQMLGQRLPAWAYHSDIYGIIAVGGASLREALKSIVGSHSSFPGGFERGNMRDLDLNGRRTTGQAHWVFPPKLRGRDSDTSAVRRGRNRAGLGVEEYHSGTAVLRGLSFFPSRLLR